MKFDLTRIGQWTEEVPFEVTEEHLQKYAAATNDTNPRHVRGELASPVFAVVPALMGIVTDAVWSVAISDRTGYDTRSVHGEQDLFLLRPLRPGMRLRSRAAVVGLHPKASSTLVVTRSETFDERGDLVNYQYWTNVMRGIVAETQAGETSPARAAEPAMAPTVANLTYHVESDQSARYAEASGDYGPYHLDEAVAKEAGWPGIILHGLCTMAFAGRAVVEATCSGDSTRLSRLAVRFANPVFLDQDLTITIHSAGSMRDANLYTFETVDERRTLVLTRGFAEVRR